MAEEVRRGKQAANRHLGKLELSPDGKPRETVQSTLVKVYDELSRKKMKSPVTSAHFQDINTPIVADFNQHDISDQGGGERPPRLALAHHKLSHQGQ